MSEPEDRQSLSPNPEHDAPLFSRGPPWGLQEWLGLRSGNRPFLRRAGITIAVGWLPLVILTAMRGDLIRSDTANSFILDFGVQTRFLLAAPLLALSEAVCVPRLAVIAREFLESGLISEADRSHYLAAVDSSRRLMNSRVAEVVLIALAYALVFAVVEAAPANLVPTWHGRLNPFAASPAGWWALLVSLPLLLLLQLGWLWRICLWARFLWLMNRLQLQLEAAHPDHSGGLAFVGRSLEAFLPIGFIVGLICAGPVANQVVHHHASPEQFQSVAIGAVIAATLLCAGPLLVFARRLIEERNNGERQYGALALRIDRRLRLKCFGPGRDMSQGTGDMSDFAGTNAANLIAANARAVKILPFELRSVGLLMVTTFLPFVPVWLLSVPFDQLARKLGGFLL
ncbi:MAG TPA: hypothetical protein VK466_04700 [Terriglobales bacterium]|nr:hypothetical protein [Terriglobales bacterium]